MSGKKDREQEHFFAAVRAGDLHLVTTLLQKGAHLLGLVDGDGTPLHVACGCNRLPVIKTLLDNEAAPDAQNVTPLHLSALRGNKDAIQLLVEAGADIDIMDTHGRAPLHVCITGGSLKHEAAAAYLIQNRASLSVVDSHRRTPLHYACEKGNAQLVHLLVSLAGAEAEAFIDLQDREGRTGLHLAARAKHVSVVTELLKLGAETTVTDRWGKFARDLAVGSGNELAVAAFDEWVEVRPRPKPPSEAGPQSAEPRKKVVLVGTAEDAFVTSPDTPPPDSRRLASEDYRRKLRERLHSPASAPRDPAQGTSFDAVAATSQGALKNVKYSTMSTSMRDMRPRGGRGMRRGRVRGHARGLRRGRGRGRGRGGMRLAGDEVSVRELHRARIQALKSGDVDPAGLSPAEQQRRAAEGDALRKRYDDTVESIMALLSSVQVSAQQLVDSEATRIVDAGASPELENLKRVNLVLTRENADVTKKTADSERKVTRLGEENARLRDANVKLRGELSRLQKGLKTQFESLLETLGSE